MQHRLSIGLDKKLTIVLLAVFYLLLFLPVLALSQSPKASNADPYEAAKLNQAIKPVNNYLMLEDETVAPMPIEDHVSNKRTSATYLYKHRLLRQIIAENQKKQ